MRFRLLGLTMIIVCLLVSCSVSYHTRLINRDGYIQNCEYSGVSTHPILLGMLSSGLESKHRMCVEQAKKYGFIEMQLRDYDRILTPEEGRDLYRQLNGEVVTSKQFEQTESGYVDVEQVTKSAAEKSSLPQDIKSINESWYFLFAPGLSVKSSWAKYFSAQDTLDEFGPTYLMCDFGLYFPTSDHTLLGATLQIDGTVPSNNFPKRSFFIYSLDLTYLRYFGTNIGDGFFYRSKIGYSKSVLSTYYGQWNDGANVAFGAGYAYPVSNTTRLQFEAGGQLYYLGDFTFVSLNVSLGFLF